MYGARNNLRFSANRLVSFDVMGVCGERVGLLRDSCTNATTRRRASAAGPGVCPLSGSEVMQKGTVIKVCWQHP